MESTRGRQIHQVALAAQEKGSFAEALKLEAEAEVSYQADGDLAGFAEIQSMQALTYSHLYEKTGFRGFLTKRKFLAMAAVELSSNSGQKESLAVPLFNLAKVQDDLGEYDGALENYQKALSALPDNATHNRPAVVADWKNHLAVCEYKNGNKSALVKAQATAEELAKAEEDDSYSKNVWLSGAHMRMALMLKTDNPVLAKEYLAKAKVIIDGDERLGLRKQQWVKLAEIIG